MSKELIMTNKTTSVDLTSPKAVASFSNELKKFVVENKLYTGIKNKNFVHVEGWQFAAASTGMMFLPTELERIEIPDSDEIKYRSVVDLVRMTDGQVIGRGFAICSNREDKKRSFAEYAVASMAQTIAIGKAGRNTLGWMMKLAGYESAPAEEVEDVPVESIAVDEVALEVKKNKVDNAIAALPTTSVAKLRRHATGSVAAKPFTDLEYEIAYDYLLKLKNESEKTSDD